MIRTIVITGAASGMGKATAELLNSKGHRIITVDIKGGDVVADLGSAEGRRMAIAEITRLAPDGIDGVLAAAGIASGSDQRVVAVNYFGVVEVLEGLRSLLAKSSSPRAVVIASTAAFSAVDERLVAALLTGNEAAAISIAPDEYTSTGYSSSKNALASWLRRASTTGEWAGSGILLNGIGPGRTRTPMIEPILATDEGRARLESAVPMALNRPYAEAWEIAELAAFLLEMDSQILVGQIVYADGGTDAIRRPGSI